jgi:2-C-methyl-D-erythritol 2,4-cyclodiphosphate synthase
MGDIGTLFPDTDEKYKGADSSQLMVCVRNMLYEKNWTVVNLDVIIHAEAPKLGPHKGQIKRTNAD